MRLQLTALVGGWLCIACSPGAPPMQVAATCSSGDLTVQIEAGHFLLSEDPRTASAVCEGIRMMLVSYREAYAVRFGNQDLRGIPVRIRSTDDLRTTGIESPLGVSGHTYGDAIDLAELAWNSLPHELNHLRTGPGHTGWCADFEPWSEEVLGINQRSYLHCR